MKSICLDTRVLSFYLKGKEAALQVIQQYKQKGYEIYTTTVNISEFYMGLFKANIVSTDKLSQLKAFFMSLHPRNLDYEVSMLAGRLYATTLKGTEIGWRDTYIAATVLLNGKKIITNNASHFQRVSELDVIEFENP